jgi:predicted phosphodiesterase
MAAIISKWTRFMAVGCSHALAIDPIARDAALKFKELWKPDLTLHLGDAIDTPSFRSGAHGTSDQNKDVQPDIDAGLDFLRQLRPQIFCCGNHEARLWELRSSPDARIRFAATQAINHITDACTEIGTKVIPYEGVYQKYIRGDVLFTHGTIYNENQCRDSAEMYVGTDGVVSKVVSVHTHKAGQQGGRTLRNSEGYNAGTLTRRRESKYANNRRSTLAWSQGIVFGEIREGRSPQSAIWLIRGPGEGDKREWRFPL